MRVLKALLIVIICFLAAAAAFSAGYATRMVFGEDSTRDANPFPRQMIVTASDPEPDENAAFQIFWEAWHLLEQHFIGDLPGVQKLSYSAIRGALQSLNDPHTLFVEPRDRQLEKDEHRGRFGGIGAWVYQREDDRQIILIPQEGSPAERAGLREGDAVVRVNDTEIDTTSMTRDDVVAMVRGPVGEAVRIAVRRDGDDGVLTFEVVREEFQTPSVEARMLDDWAPNVGYLRISLFTERTGGEVEKMLHDLYGQGAERLVLDLRDNPGGLLDSAIDVASQFLESGIVMYELNRDGSEKEYPVLSGGSAQQIPLVVLSNGGSASASEIVAGALQDRERALLVGEKTYGKGSVQLVFDLSDGSSIHITVAKWLTPNRDQIDGQGIAPDVDIPISSEDRQQGRDPQLAEAVARVLAAPVR